MNADILARCIKYLEENDVSIRQAIILHQGTEMNKTHFDAAGKRMKRDGSKYAGRRKKIESNLRGMSLPFSDFGLLVKGEK